MKIYTKTGDRGETGLWGGPRVRKNDLRIQAYGTFDELNASLGALLAQFAPSPTLVAELRAIQSELFVLGGELATPTGKKSSLKLIEKDATERLERQIDAMESKLTPLKSFILPGGAPASALLHQARTVSRRAERELITLHDHEPVRAEVLEYVNRLSDYLFVAARFANHTAGVADVPWVAPTKE